MAAPSYPPTPGYGTAREGEANPVSTRLEAHADAAHAARDRWDDVVRELGLAHPHAVSPDEVAHAYGVAADAAKAAAAADDACYGSHAAARRQLPRPLLLLALDGATAAAWIAFGVAERADAAATEALSANPNLGAARLAWDASAKSLEAAELAEAAALELGALRRPPTRRGQCRACGTDARGKLGRVVYWDSWATAAYSAETSDVRSKDVVKARLCRRCYDQCLVAEGAPHEQ